MISLNVTASFSWTDEAVAKLREWHADGYSFADIANMLTEAFPRQGIATRNACIGKANRLHLVKKGRPKPGAAKRRRANPQPKVAPQDSPAQTRLRMADFSAALAQEAAPVRLPHEVEGDALPLEPASLAPPEAPPMAAPDCAPRGGVGFFALRLGVCKFPINPTPKYAQHSFIEFRACGAAALLDKPYCAQHHRLCTQPGKPRAVGREQGFSGGHKLSRFKAEA